ncbi:hypothetical protein AVEN_131594-1 [Araneus ventricosus]|uniref:Uncharacterized protein n=1 Tax=Araneus ventricosus TaxID=182803 RepID=A0A4Y2ESG3_ARAVE|nr:hypothetical protein AVEN_131594-1 [Araneus ventricosus]
MDAWTEFAGIGGALVSWIQNEKVLDLRPDSTEGRGGLVVRSRLWGGGLQVRNPIPLKIRRVWGLLHAKSYVVAKRPPVGVAWKFGEEVPAQVSSSSSDHGSKL